MWSSDDGIARPEAEQLLTDLTRQLADTPLTRMDTRESSACLVAGWAEEDQRIALRRMATALIRACLHGRTANFKVTESIADQIFRVFIGSEHTNLGLIIVFALASAGLIVVADWLVLSRLLSPISSSNRVPCQCRMCLETVVKGPVIGEGGFGQVFRCAVDGERASPEEAQLSLGPQPPIHHKRCRVVQPRRPTNLPPSARNQDD